MSASASSKNTLATMLEKTLKQLEQRALNDYN